MESWPDDRYDAESSPDVLLTDGADEIAIEIKQLTDGESFHTHGGALQSLYEGLAPDSARSYMLFPPPSIRLPLDRTLVKQIRPRIASAATELRVGKAVEVPIPRRATVRFLGQSDVGFVKCFHARSDDVRAVSREVTGSYLLEDSGGPDHQFLSEERRLSFYQALTRACRDSERGERAEVEWFEEWELRRGEDSDKGEGGVLVFAAVGVFLESAAIESVDKAIRSAKKKFEAKKWARRQAVALHAGEQQQELSPALFGSAIARLEAADVQPLDSVFLVSGTHVRSFNFTR